MSAEIRELTVGAKGPTRIKQLLRTGNLRQKDIARAIGISESQLSYMLSEERAITSDIARQLANRFGGTVDDYVWDLGRKTIPDGLVTGDDLRRLCFQGNLLKGIDQCNVATSHINLRIARRAAVTSMCEPGPPKEWDLEVEPLRLYAGQMAHLSVFEELELPGDIQASFHVLPNCVSEGFCPIALMLPPSSASFPPILLQYWGEQSVELTVGQVLFSLTLTKI